MTLHRRQKVPIKVWVYKVASVSDRDAIINPRHNALCHVTDDGDLYQFDKGVDDWVIVIGRTLPTYADEATALGGGLSSGKMYKTATGEVRVKL